MLNTVYVRSKPFIMANLNFISQETMKPVGNYSKMVKWIKGLFGL